MPDILLLHFVQRMLTHNLQPKQTAYSRTFRTWAAPDSFVLGWDFILATSAGALSMLIPCFRGVGETGTSQGVLTFRADYFVSSLACVCSVNKYSGT